MPVNRVKIYDEEMMESPIKEDPMLHLARSKGVPLDGTFAPKLKKDIEYSFYRSFEDLATVIIWKTKYSFKVVY